MSRLKYTMFPFSSITKSNITTHTNTHTHTHTQTHTHTHSLSLCYMHTHACIRTPTHRSLPHYSECHYGTVIWDRYMGTLYKLCNTSDWTSNRPQQELIRQSYLTTAVHFFNLKVLTYKAKKKKKVVFTVIRPTLSTPPPHPAPDCELFFHIS